MSIPYHPIRRGATLLVPALAILSLLIAGFAGPQALRGAAAPAHDAGRPAAKSRPAAPRAATAANWQAGEVLVRLAAGAGLGAPAAGAGPLHPRDAALAAVLRAQGLARGETLDAAGGLFRLYAAAPGFDVAAAVRALQAAPGVIYAEPDLRVQAATVPNDPLYARQWYLNQIAAPAAWDITTGSSAVTVAMIDTGVSSGHPELAGRLVPGYNFVSDNSDASDDNGHGTYTAGLVGALTNNGVGVAGVAWNVRIMPVKILDRDGGGNIGDFARGIHWAVDHGARVLNISAGIDYASNSMQDAVRYARQHGAVIVASAGNTPDGAPRYPAGFEEVIGVSATDAQDHAASFSSYGDFVDVSAPGVDILGLGWTGQRAGYEWASGTSSAAPLVTGAAALLLSLKPSLTPTEVQRLLEEGADDIGPPGWDPHFGAGRLDIARSLILAGGAPPTARPTIAPAPPTTAPATATATAPPAPPATPPAPAGAALTLDPAHAGPGATVTLIGHGYAPGEAVGLRMTGPEGANHELGTAMVDPSGAFQQPVTIPAALGPGAGTMMALGAHSNALATAPITIDAGPVPAPATAPTLPPEPGPTASPTPPAPAPDALAPNPTAAFAPATDPAVAGVTYFAPVQHTLRGPFLRYWQQHGGLPVFGYPLSEEFMEQSATDGKTYRVQYFERNRFEYHPEFAGTPNEVLLGLLGRDATAGRVFDLPAAPLADATHVYFPQTGHVLGGAFLAYWRARGGLPIFGYPIS
jgi:subtilisin family serine protease